MAHLHNDIYDNGLTVLSTATATVMHLCSQEPATLEEVASYSVGYSESPSIGAPASRSPSGRKVTVAAIEEGTATVDEATAAYWALVDASRLLATSALIQEREVHLDVPWSLGAFDIEIPGPAA